MEKVFENGVPQRGYIFKRDNSIYYLYFSAYQKRIRRSLNTDNYLTALQKSYVMIDEILKGVIKTPYFKQVAAEYLKTVRNQNKKDYFSEKLKKLYFPKFSKLKINEITTQALNDFIFERLENLKPQSINREMTVISQILKFAYKKGYISEIPIIERQKEDKARREAFTPEQVEELLTVAKNRINAIPNARLKYDRTILLYLIIFLLNTGLRLSEALSIKFNSINGEYAYLGKSKTIRREIFLNDDAQQVIEKLKKLYAVNNILFTSDSPLFLNYQGKPSYNFKKGFKSLMDDTSMKKYNNQNIYTLYSCRHTYISMSLKNSVNVATIAIQTGTSIRMIEKNYNHLKIHQVKNELK